MPEESMDQLEQLKDLLSEPKQAIKLTDFMAHASKNIVSELNELSVQMQPNNDTFVSRIQKYEEAMQGMLTNEMLLGRWAQKQQSKVLTMPVKRIAAAISPAGGNSHLLTARWYPVLLLLYAGCIGALAGDNYEVIHELTHLSGLPNPYGRRNDDVLLISVFKNIADINDGFKSFPGLEKRQTPRSEHIHKLLESTAEDILYLGTDYEQIFDRAELVMSLEFIHLDHPETIGQGEWIWAPVGKFGWKNLHSHPLKQLAAEAAAAGDSWPPLQAGLFGGSSGRFLELAGSLSKFVNRLGWS
jgi:hypothetical protein